MDTITLTFSEVVENYVGMQQIGVIAENGYSLVQLINIKKQFEALGCKTELININRFLNYELKGECGAFLWIKNGASKFVDINELEKEQSNLDVDKKAFMYGRVVNKHARYNLCFDDKAQEPDYQNKKGRIVDYKSVPYTEKIKNNLKKIINEDLKCEGNYYYDNSKCGIGWHGDAERKKVFGLRLGKKMCLKYRWYKNSKQVSDTITFNLKSGDLYVMNEKATGNDWKMRSKYTLRHSAGCKKFTE